MASGTPNPKVNFPPDEQLYRGKFRKKTNSAIDPIMDGACSGNGTGRRFDGALQGIA